MKILRHTGQKVLEAPVHAKNIYKLPSYVVVDLNTVDRNTLYYMLLTTADIKELTKSLKGLS